MFIFSHFLSTGCLQEYVYNLYLCELLEWKEVALFLFAKTFLKCERYVIDPMHTFYPPRHPEITTFPTRKGRTLYLLSLLAGTTRCGDFKHTRRNPIKPHTSHGIKGCWGIAKSCLGSLCSSGAHASSTLLVSVYEVTTSYSMWTNIFR